MLVDLQRNNGNCSRTAQKELIAFSCGCAFFFAVSVTEEIFQVFSQRWRFLIIFDARKPVIYLSPLPEMLSAGDAVPWQSSGGGATDMGGGSPRHGEDFLNLRETRLGISASSKAERATKKKKKLYFLGWKGSHVA